MKKIAIIYITYDGIINTMCGVGVISRTFIDIFPEIKNFLKGEGIDLHLHLITPALNKNALGYSDEIKKQSLDVVLEVGGDIHYIVNGTDGTEQFGTISNWNIISSAAASKSLEIAQIYDKTIVYCVDTPFMYTPYFINIQKNAYKQQNIIPLLTLHSDVLSHHPDSIDMQRLGWEASAIKYCALNPNIKIAATSKFLINHLKNHYAIPESQIINLQSGINVNSKRYAPISSKKIEKYLQSYNIPLNKKLIFSVGRAVPYKGFDLLIESFAKVIDKNTHLVFIASPYLNTPSNIQEIKDLLSKYQISVTALLHIEFKLPQYICQWKNTKIVAQLSRNEPFGLVPEEVRIWSQKAGPLVMTSKKDGFVEQILEGEDGFMVNLNSPSSIAEKMEYILSLNDKTIENIRKRGLKRVYSEYDYRVSVLNSIVEILKFDKSLVRKFKKNLNYENIY
jgi:glycosyltransferase involved in cell wall biosynthesis